jgi:hypothetical protein
MDRMVPGVSRLELKTQTRTRGTNPYGYLCTSGAIRPKDSSNTLLIDNKEVVHHIFVAHAGGPAQSCDYPYVFSYIAI